MAIKKRKIKRTVKIALYVMILLLVFSMFWVEIMVAKKGLNNKSVSYSKESKLNYVTYLKDNSHYENTYLQDEFNLVASLVDYFSLDYSYTYALGESVNYELSYGIDAILEVYDRENEAKPIEKKKYTLLEKQTSKGNGKLIKAEVFNHKVKYDTYNEIVQAWKKEISPNANLKISINVEWKGHSDKLNKDFSDNCVNEFNIPISQKTIDIKAPNNISESGIIKTKQKLSKKHMLLISSTLALFLIILVNFVVYIMKGGKYKSKYEQKINKLLREFDRAITEAKGEFVKYEGETYVEVKDFMELLDVHDNINEPIIHYSNGENLSVFVIKNGDITYYTTIKRSELDD